VSAAASTEPLGGTMLTPVPSGRISLSAVLASSLVFYVSAMTSAALLLPEPDVSATPEKILVTPSD